MASTNFWNYGSSTNTSGAAKDQTKVPIEIKRARHNYYYVIRDGSYGVHNAPYMREALGFAMDQIALVLPTTALAQAKTRSAAMTLAQKEALVEKSRDALKVDGGQ